MSERGSPHCSSYYQSFSFWMFDRRCSKERMQRLGVAVPSWDWSMSLCSAWEYRLDVYRQEGSIKCENKTCETVFLGQWVIMVFSVLTVTLKLKIKYWLLSIKFEIAWSFFPRVSFSYFFLFFFYIWFSGSWRPFCSSPLVLKLMWAERWGELVPGIDLQICCTGNFQFIEVRTA